MSLSKCFSEEAIPVRDWPEYSGEMEPLTVFGDNLLNGWYIDYMSNNTQTPYVQPQIDSRASGMRRGPGLCVNLLAKVSYNAFH
jgi:hypothetical protein